jgi:hypothetical protein
MKIKITTESRPVTRINQSATECHFKCIGSTSAVFCVNFATVVFFYLLLAILCCSFPTLCLNGFGVMAPGWTFSMQTDSKCLESGSIFPSAHARRYLNSSKAHGILIPQECECCSDCWTLYMLRISSPIIIKNHFHKKLSNSYICSSNTQSWK